MPEQGSNIMGEESDKAELEDVDIEKLRHINADELEDIDYKPVNCPSCNQTALQWTSDEKYGIECPHCGFIESFSK
ncbi:hypothetical protein [Haladaptatus sp. NG-SE-30]